MKTRKCKEEWRLRLVLAGRECWGTAVLRRHPRIAGLLCGVAASRFAGATVAVGSGGIGLLRRALVRFGAVATTTATVFGGARRRPDRTGEPPRRPSPDTASAVPSRHPVLRIVGRHQPRFFRAALLSVLSQLGETLQVLFIGWFLLMLALGESATLSRLGLPGATAQLWVLAAVAVLFRVATTGLSYGTEVTWHQLGQDVQHDWRAVLYPHVQHMEMRHLEGERTTRVAGVLTDDLHGIGDFVTSAPHEFLQLVICFLVMVPAYLLLAPQIAWIAFLPVPFVIWLSFRHRKRSAADYVAVTESRARLTCQVINNLEASATVKSFCTEEFEADRVKELSDRYRRTSHYATRRSLRHAQAVYLCTATSMVGTLLLGGREVLAGALSAEAVSPLIGLPQLAIWKLTRLGSTVEHYHRALSALDRVEHLRNLPVETDREGRRLDLRQLKGEVLLDRVTFAYPGRAPVLRDLSLRIAAGRTTGIVGATGAGKTTIAKLLMRFEDPQAGRVLLDGQDTRELHLHDLRSVIGFVAQDVFLFDGSIGENIGYGRTGVHPTDVTRAAGLAEADSFVAELPARYDAVIGERGAALSGGQKQRIALARTFLKDPRIVILDEATSAVDNETEAAVQRNLQEFSEDRTVLIIAHRLSTIRHADQIYVLDKDGVLAEEGTHDELVAHDGLYASLWRLQTGEHRA